MAKGMQMEGEMEEEYDGDDDEEDEEEEPLLMGKRLSKKEEMIGEIHGVTPVMEEVGKGKRKRKNI